MFHPSVIAAKKERFERALFDKYRRKFSFKEYSFDEVEYWRERMKGAFSPTGEKLRILSPEEDLYVFNELNLSALDWKYFVERHCVILSDKKQLEPLRLRGSQQMVLNIIAEEEKRQVDVGAPYIKLAFIIAKARQLGLSVLCQGINGNIIFLNPNTRGISASDHEDSTKNLWNILLRIHENLPPWMRPNIGNQRFGEYLRLDRLGSEVVFSSGNQKTSMGQGRTTEILHLTEVSTWEFPDVIDDDILPSFNSSRAPLSAFFLESTGAGIDEEWFHQQYQLAKDGLSIFKPIFVAWFSWVDKYSMPSEGVTFSNSTLEMAKRVKEEHKVELSRDQLAWYEISRKQFESKGKLEFFLQEYPTFEEEAFQAGVPRVFSPIEVKGMKLDAKEPESQFEVNTQTGKLKPLTPVKRATMGGVLSTWDFRQPGFTYVVGCDPATGMGSDSSAINVNLVGTSKWIDEQVAEWWGQVDSFELATVLWTIGHLYADDTGYPARIIIEITGAGGGLQTQQELIRRHYPNLYINRKLNVIGGGYTKALGWNTTPTSRRMLTDMGVKYLKEGLWRIHSWDLLREMNGFMNYSTKRGRHHLEHAPGAHDDLLFAGFLALYASHEDDVIDMASERRELQEKVVKRLLKKPTSLQEFAFQHDYTMEEALEAISNGDLEDSFP